MNEDPHSLPTPLTEAFYAIAWGTHKQTHYFDLGSLFWSLTRLFGCYHRIVAINDPRAAGPNTGDTSFLDADVEAFIIRFRVLLNNIAFIFRQLYPSQTAGLPQLRRVALDRNKEVSFRDLHKFLKRNPSFHPTLFSALESNANWLYTLVDHRDALLHFKAMVLIFEPSQDERAFAVIRAGGDEPRVRTPEGGERIVTIPVFTYINEQMRNLHRFMDVDLVNAATQFALENGMTMAPLGIPGTARMRCVGIELYRKINNLESDS